MDKYISANAGYVGDLSRTDTNGMSEAHTHDYYEIYYFCGEEMIFFLESMPITLHKHDIVLIDKHVFHKTCYNCPQERNTRANISFNTGFLHRYFDLKNIEKILRLFETPLLVNTESDIQEKNHSLITSACASFDNNKEYATLTGYYNLCILLVEFLQNAELFRSVPSADALSPSQNRIAQITMYINMNYSKSISLTSIAQDFYISKFFLSHSFKETLGVSITDFINRKRVNEAANLLENTDMSLTEITNAVGFNNQTYFIKTFKHYHKTTPGKYRATKRNLRERFPVPATE